MHVVLQAMFSACASACTKDAGLAANKAVGKAAGSAAKAVIPVPILNEVAGWAAEESIQWLLVQAAAIVGHPKQCRKLLRLLRDPCLLKAVHALDQLTELTQFADHRRDYHELCDTLQQAELLLLQHSHTAEGPQVESRAWRWWHRVTDSKTPKQLRISLERFCRLELKMQLFTTLQVMASPPAPQTISRAERSPSLHSYLGPDSDLPEYSEPDLPTHIFQHNDDLVPQIDEQLWRTRNIGIVGHGGIGKTTVAQAVYELAKTRFDAAVWLTVGKDADDAKLLELLESAFARLFPDTAIPFTSVDQGRQALAQLLHGAEEGQSPQTVLLVLDNLWPASEGRPSQLSSLNFATHPDMRVSDSRLIVTTRSSETLSYPSRSSAGGTIPMHERQLFSPPLLEVEPAQQLFYHHAFNVSDAELPGFLAASTDIIEQLIHSCGGNPLALKVLGSTLKSCRTAEEWEQRLAAQREQQAQGKDEATVSCETSVAALPPSLKECFIEFGSLQGAARMHKEALLHLFAARAPLHTPASVRAAAAKLDQLVSRSLVAQGVDDQKRPVFYMHDILRSIALRLSDQTQTRSFCGTFPNEAAGGDTGPQAGPPTSMQVDVSPNERSSCRRMVQFMWLHEPVTRQPPHDGSASDGCILRWPMLKFLKLQLGTSRVIKSLELQLPSLLHLDLSGCLWLQTLPRGVTDCHQLMHLNLHACEQLRTLPEAIRNLGQLEHLDLGGCAALDSLPDGIGGCTHLQHLDLRNLSQYFDLPEGLSKLTQLVHLNCKHSKLLLLPHGINQCRKLKYVNLRCLDKHVFGLPEAISSWSALLQLDLSGRKIDLLPDISACIHLRDLDLGRCLELQQLSEGISGCRQLKRLNLRECWSLDNLPEGIGSCINLTYLDLGKCCKLETLPEGLSRCSALKHLDLSGCYRVPSLPQGINNWKHLKHLDLGYCRGLQGLSLDVRMCEFVKLQHLDLSGCDGLEQLPVPATGFSQFKLRNLCLSNCRRLMHLPDRLSECSQLANLELNGCERLAQLPDGIGRCSQLKHLKLSGCMKLEKLPQSISSCSQLKQLDLSNCQSMACLPTGITSCSKLRIVNIRGCGVSAQPRDDPEVRRDDPEVSAFREMPRSRLYLIE